VIEVYRGNQKAERNFGIYSLYVMFFPQLVTGPIERPGNLLRQLHEEKKFDYDNISKGFRLIIFGLFIKMVVADNLGYYVDMIYEDPSKYNSWDIILGMIFYSFQIYGDFFGYSTIALGSAKLIGFDITDNFNTPYLSKSIAEFWHRWHISLSTWFRDYVYFPLGGSRVKFSRWAFNILIVFILSGIWHGAAWNFIFWGLAHGLLHIFEKFVLNHIPEKEHKGRIEKIIVDAFKIAKTFILVTLFWSLFRATSFTNISDLFTSLVNNFGVNEHLHIENGIWIYLGLFIVLDVMLYNTRFDKWCDKFPAAIRWSIYFILIFMIITCSSVNNFPFIYFQF
jgi:D-alanyl-lipoteichoic acid acyltransferase DltB (MBOAT superfamily)